MDKYVCPCGYVYDPAVGDPDNGVAPGTPWERSPRIGSAPPASWARTCSKRNKDKIRAELWLRPFVRSQWKFVQPR